MSRVLDAAKYYLQHGFQPVPVPAGRKGPILAGWQSLRLKEADLATHFSAPSQNIGILLGEPSGWLVDVDLDSPEARELAAEYLPPTPVVTGRPGSPNSHYWYFAEDTVTKQHRDPKNNSVIVELRSTGAQTLVGPSTHLSGEPYDMLLGEPARVEGPALASAVAELARAVVKARHGEEAVQERPQLPLSGPCRVPAAEDEQSIERRAVAYLDALPSAVSGHGGHKATYTAAVALVHGFGIHPDRALHLLVDHYNPRCEPEWTIKELRHKVDDAANRQHDCSYGWLRDANDYQVHSGVDLSAFDIATEPRPESLDPVDPGPFPKNLFTVPGFIDDIMRYNLATAIKPQPILALGAAISLQATLAARKVRDPRGNRTNLYIIGVAPSGYGKDHARKVNRNILYDAGLEHLEGNEDIASDAGLINAVAEQPAILFQIDEFGRFLSTIGDPKRSPHLYNVLTAFMKMYSSADTIFRGKCYAESKRNKTIYQPCVNLYATTVAERLFDALTPESVSDGFVPRLMAFELWENPPRQRVDAEPVPSSLVETARWWGDFCPGGNLGKERPIPQLVDYTDEAGGVFDDLAAKVDQEVVRRNVPGCALWARAEEKACRLALVYACSKNRENPIIDTEAADWACELSVYLTRRMLFVANQWIAEGAFDAKQKKVLRIIRNVGGTIGHSELYNRTRSLSPRERKEVIENLLETDQIERIITPTATKPKVTYSVR